MNDRQNRDNTVITNAHHSTATNSGSKSGSNRFDWDSLGTQKDIVNSKKKDLSIIIGYTFFGAIILAFIILIITILF